MQSSRDTPRQQSPRHGHNAGEATGYYADDDDDNDNADVVDSPDDNKDDVDDDEPICLSANLDSPLSRYRPTSWSRSGAEIIPFADLP